jgi:hypothetical protein
MATCKSFQATFEQQVDFESDIAAGNDFQSPKNVTGVSNRGTPMLQGSGCIFRKDYVNF